MVSRHCVQHFPSNGFDSGREGFIIISSSEDLVELIATPGMVSKTVLKKIIATSIKMLDDTSALPAKNADKKP